MEVVAKLRRARISPTKVREVIGLIKGKPVEEASVILGYSNRKAAFILRKLLDSAVANALDRGFDVDKMRVFSVTADDGIRLKRFRTKAMGRAGRILKRTSNITIVLK